MWHTITVSMKGSSSATMPWRTGSLVIAAECAIGAEPQPASFEKAARRKPMIITPTTPPHGGVRREGLREDRGEGRGQRARVQRAG